MWQHLKNNQLKYGFGVVLTLILLVLLDAYICRIFIKDFKLFSNIFQSLLNHIDTTEKIKPSSLGAGLIAIIGLRLFFRRLENQKQQIELQIDQRIDERFNSAIGLLGSNETSARTGAIYALYELAMEEGKYRKQIAQILCSHIRSKTQEKDYQKEHTHRPSNEIQTCIKLLFEEVLIDCKKLKIRGNNTVISTGLYAKFLPELLYSIDLSHSYLVGANFRNANCTYATFSDAQLQEVIFIDSTLDDADFKWCNLQLSYFKNCEITRVCFNDAQCQGACFGDTNCHHSTFINTNFQGAYFDFSCTNEKEIYGGNFYSNVLFQGAQNIDCDRKNLKYRIGEPATIGGFGIEKKNLGVLEDSEEIQAIIAKDWDKLKQLQNAK